MRRFDPRGYECRGVSLNQCMKECADGDYYLVGEVDTQIAELTAQLKKAEDALREISQYRDCEGPGCHYCERDFHPPSVEAKVAQDYFKEVKG